jgi:hypothetical protein
MNKDQKLLEEAYQKVLQEETNLQKALKEIEASSKESERKKEEKLKDLSRVIADQLGTDEKGSFVYRPSIYKPGGVYKSYIGSLFSSDLKEVPLSTPIEEGMMWTEQDINTINVYRATMINGRLMKTLVPSAEAKQKGLTKLISNYALKKEAERKFNGNIDLARGWLILRTPVDFNAKFYSPEEIFRSLEALYKDGKYKKEYEKIVGIYKQKFKEKEIDTKLSDTFNQEDLEALKDF